MSVPESHSRTSTNSLHGSHAARGALRASIPRAQCWIAFSTPFARAGLAVNEPRSSVPSGALIAGLSVSFGRLRLACPTFT
jgi:hypothetical protein